MNDGILDDDDGRAGPDRTDVPAPGRPEDPVVIPSPEQVDEEVAEPELTSDLDQMQRKITDVNDRHLRLAAEFENYRKRAQGEMAEAWTRAQADMVRRIIDSLDDLQRVTAMDPAEVSASDVLEGVELIERNLMRGLREAGVEVLDPAGESFDPRTMEAVMRVPAETAEDEDRVADVFQKGYVLKGHLIRPARVTVRISS